MGKKLTLEELSDETYKNSNSFGPIWRSLLDEVTYNVARKRHPQNYGFFGYGESGYEWSDDDIIQLQISTLNNQILPNNSHVKIIALASNISNVKGVLGRKVQDELSRIRIRSVDENTFDNLKKILKEKYNIVLPTSGSTGGAQHEKEIKDLEALFRTFKQHWRLEGQVGRTGKTYTRLPKLFKLTDLEKASAAIAAMSSLPVTGEIWDLLRRVIDVREGSQAYLEEKLNRQQAQSVGNPPNAITPSSHTEGEYSGQSNRDISDNMLDYKQYEPAVKQLESLISLQEGLWLVKVYDREYAEEYLAAHPELQAESLGLQNQDDLGNLIESLEKKANIVREEHDLSAELLEQVVRILVHSLNPTNLDDITDAN
jgi:hypothetical protein